jgi:hypothetical protein
MAKELLNDVTIRNTKPTDKDQRLNDGSGLYLLIKSNGAKWWRFDYTINRTRKTLSVGVYPKITLADARRKAEQARNQVSNGINPSDTRKLSKAEQKLIAENEKRRDAGLPALGSFETVAWEWYAANMVNKSASYQTNIKAHLQKDLIPAIGNLPLGSITHDQLLDVFKLCELRSATTVHKVSWIYPSPLNNTTFDVN